MCENGHSVAQNYAEAAELYKAAADVRIVNGKERVVHF